MLPGTIKTFSRHCHISLACTWGSENNSPMCSTLYAEYVELKDIGSVQNTVFFSPLLNNLPPAPHDP